MRLWVLLILVGLIVSVAGYDHIKQAKGKELPPLADGDTSDLDDEDSVDEKRKPASRKKPAQKKNTADDYNPLLAEVQDVFLSRLDEIQEDLRYHLGIDPASGVELKYDDDEDEDKPAKPAKTSGKKPKPARKAADETDDSTTVDLWEVCDSSRDEPCTCELEELHCDKTVFQDLLPLDTPNVDLHDKAFVVKKAFFTGNAIKKLKKDKILFGHTKQVEELDFTDNQIDGMDVGVFEPLSSLSTLRLTHNLLTTIKKEWFKGANGLKYLYLDENRISKIEPGTFKDMKTLTKLVLDGNRLKLTKGSFVGLENLEALSLDNCNLADIDVNLFDHLPKLKKLSLRGNPFDEVPRAVNALDQLEALDISETNVAEFHAQSLKDDHKVKRLIMESMPYLYAIQDCAFCGLQKLEALELKNNTKLYELHPNAFGSIKADNKVTSLKELYLEGGNLSTISESLVNWDKITHFTLGGNPINCTCQTAFLLGGDEFHFEHSNNIPKCAYPAALKGRPLAKVDPWESCSSISKKEKVGRAVLFLSMMLFLVSFGLLGYLLYSSGRLDKLIGRAKGVRDNFPTMSYSNLSHTDEGRSLEADFQPRPEEV